MHEVFPAVNPIVVQQVQGTDAIIYGMGSLYTSICPSLILRGVGEAVAQCHGIPKVLLLNGSLDRETEGMDAVDFVHAITDALNRRGEGRLSSPLRHPPSAYITTLFHPRGGSVNVDLDRLIELGIHEVREVDSTLDTVGHCIFCPESLVSALQQLVEESRFKKHTTPFGVIPE